MTKGITGKEPDPRVIYGDIIDLPHHQSPTRPHMSIHDRAAQFAPFLRRVCTGVLYGFGTMSALIHGIRQIAIYTRRSHYDD